MEQLRQQNAQTELLNRIIKIIKILNRILTAVNALLESEKRKREDNIIKDIKNLFRLRKERDNSATKDSKNLFRLKNTRNANKVIKEIFESLLSRYQIGLETSMKWSDFIFDGVSLLCYKWHNKS